MAESGSTSAMPIQSWRARVPDLQVLLTGPEETFLEDVDGVEMLPAPASAALVAAVAVLAQLLFTMTQIILRNHGGCRQVMVVMGGKMDRPQEWEPRAQMLTA